MKDTEQTISTPYFLIYEDRIRRNLELIKRVSSEAGVNIIMAFKANAVWRLFPVLREYGFGFAASSPNELRLGYEELHTLGHTYFLAYKVSEFKNVLSMSSHVTFNSLNQWNEHKDAIKDWNSKKENHKVTPGLRVNPHCSVIETDLYNPALPGSRFGVNTDDLTKLPEGIEGLHFHQLCESDSHDLKKVLDSFEDQFGYLLPQLKWVNMGGGHLMTRDGYDIDCLVDILKNFRDRYPHIEVILEPGSAFMWHTGNLIVTVMDIVEDSGVTTAIIDGSFTCHMPDTLEMPYKPIVSESLPEGETEGYKYKLGGNSCLSGDFKGDWYFKDPLKVGDELTLEDMNHYTTVKTTMFNGLQHPSIVLAKADGSMEVLRTFTYEDYKSRMS